MSDKMSKGSTVVNKTGGGCSVSSSAKGVQALCNCVWIRVWDTHGFELNAQKFTELMKNNNVLNYCIIYLLNN